MILAILQARSTSTRLPQKVLQPVLGTPMLMRQIERVQRAKNIDNLLVATSMDATDDAIERLCVEGNVFCFRGSLDDVLDRFYRAAQQFSPDQIVRLTGDCPLSDPGLIDDVIEFHVSGGYDYVSSALEPTFPDGLDVEVFRFSCLEEAWREAELPSQREHVTLFINGQPNRYKIGSFRNDTDLSHLRWTVDEPVDFELISKIYEALYPSKPAFTMRDILELLDSNPELKDINSHHGRNEGLQKSLAKDLLYMENNKRG